jgi:putative outer membrane autotransporter barrel
LKQGPFWLYFIQQMSLLSIASFTKHFLLLLLFFPERIFAKILCRTRGKNRKIFPAFTQFYHDLVLNLRQWEPPGAVPEQGKGVCPMQHGSLRAPVRVFMAAVLLCLSFLAAPKAAAAQLQNVNGITLLSFDSQQIVSIGNQTSGRCSWYALRYARTILDGKPCSGSGMWSNGAVWSAAGYYAYSGSLSGCLSRLYEELQAGRPVIVHLKNTAVSGVSKHTNRVTSYEYHLSGSGWKEVNYPHIATSSTYGHWVCVVGISPTADPENLRESDFYALDPARVSVNGTLAVTKLLDGTIWTDNSPLKVAA